VWWLTIGAVVVLVAAWWFLDRGPDVAIVGDSITFVSTDQIRHELGRDFDPDIAAVMGITAGQAIPAAQATAGGDPAQAVINLGSNDVLHNVALTQTAKDLGTLVATFPRARCIHIVNINEAMTDSGRPVRARAALLNAAIAKLAASDPRISVIDWNRTVAVDIAAHPPAGTLVDDTVHPALAGRTVLARQIRAALDSCKE